MKYHNMLRSYLAFFFGLFHRTLYEINALVLSAGEALVLNSDWLS